MRWLLVAILLAPTAAAGVPFEIQLEDARGDVKDMQGRVVNYTSADILSLRSELSNGAVIQRVRMAAPPTPPADSIFVRTWFHNSTNGSFWTIDLEVNGGAADPKDRFLPLMRRGDFQNVTYIGGDSRYHVENDTWIFKFNSSLIDDATCFDPGVFADHFPPARTRLPQAGDSLYLPPEQRRCLTSEEPGADLPSAIPRFNLPSPDVEPAAEAPGTRTPTPGLGVWGLVVATVVASMRRAPIG